MKKVKLFDSVFDSFYLIFKNLLLFIPDTVFFLISALLLIVFAYINGLFSLLSFTEIVLTDQLKLYIQNLIQDTPSLIKLIVSFIVLLLINIIIGISLISMRYTMIRSLLLNKVLRLKGSYFESKQYILPMILMKLILFFVYVIPLLIIIPLFVGLVGLPVVGVVLLALLYTILFVLLFFVYPLLFFGKSRNSFTVLKNTCKFCIKNLKYSLLVVLIVLVVSVIVAVIISYISSGLTSLFSQFSISLLNQFLFILLFIVMKFVDIALTLWTETFSFITYKSKGLSS